MSRQAPRGQLVTGRTASVWKTLVILLFCWWVWKEDLQQRERKETPDASSSYLQVWLFSIRHFPIQAALFLLERGRHSIPSFEWNVSAIYNHFAGFIPLDLMIALSEHGTGSSPPPQNNAVPLYLSCAFGGDCHTFWLGVCLSTSWVPIPSNTATNSCDPVPSSSVSAHADGRL